MRLATALLLALLTASCQRAPVSQPHYVLGAPYQAGGVWYYPRESYEGVETGLAVEYPPGHAALTTDGEVYDSTALAAAHQTLQLPAIARLTNLENGLQVLVRVNDRGPAAPNRLVQVTRRTATLLRFSRDSVVRVRLEVLPAESRAAADAVPGAPRLDLVVAPRDEVQQSDLPPLGAAAQARAVQPVAAAQAQSAQAVAPIVRLPETVWQGRPEPGRLFIRLGVFRNREYAGIQRARVATAGADIVTMVDGRERRYQVVIGPLDSVQRADIVLDQVIRSGVTDARIVVE